MIIPVVSAAMAASALTAEDQSRLLRFCRAIGPVLEADPLVKAVSHRLCELLDAQRAIILFHHDDHAELVSLGAPSAPVVLDDTHTATGQAWRTGEPVLVRDTFADARFMAEVASQAGYLPRSLMIAPLSIVEGGSCPGVILVMHDQMDHFTPRHLQLLQAAVVQVTVALGRTRLMTPQRRQFVSFVAAIAKALDARDPNTHLHSINVANYSQGIAYYLGLDAQEQEWLRLAGLLHDVGKIATPEAILRKPGPLNEQERQEIKRHAAFTGSILSQIEFIDEYRGMHHIVAAHHEKLDGSGYPWGLAAEQICLRTRILAVADIYDALTQDRSYRQGMSMVRALGVIDDMTPHQLDAHCVEALKRFLGVLPVLLAA